MSHSESVLELGRKLVEQLGLDDSTDTLARWMAHYIAERIKEVEAAPSDQRNKTRSECCDEILKLWAHRSVLPQAKRPFASFEPVFRALESLDPESKSRRFYQLTTKDEHGESDETKQWLERASLVDKSARMLIRHCIANAAQTSLNKESEWVRLATKTSSVSTDDLRVINQIAAYLQAATPKESKKESLKESIYDLNQLSELTNEMTCHLQKRLNETKE